MHNPLESEYLSHLAAANIAPSQDTPDIRQLSLLHTS